MNDAYYNSDNLQSDGHDAYVAREQRKWRRELLAKFYNDLERFPLPICFDPHEELKQLNLRTMYIEQCIDRLISIDEICFNKKYFPRGN